MSRNKDIRRPEAGRSKAASVASVGQRREIGRSLVGRSSEPRKVPSTSSARSESSSRRDGSPARINAFQAVERKPSKGPAIVPRKPSTSKENLSSRVSRSSFPPKKPETAKGDAKRPAEKAKTSPKPTLTRQRTLTKLLTPSQLKSLQDHLETKSPEEPPENPDDEYEDDFESYESDFEDCTSSDTTNAQSSSDEKEEPKTLPQKPPLAADEEKKLDSGNYDLSEAKHRQKLDRIKEAIEKENAVLDLANHPQSSLASLTDEGFEDEKRSLGQAINFEHARRLQQLGKVQATCRQRGKDILGMIRLDKVGYPIFEAEPIAYDEFMQSYGRQGTLQASAQTGEDDVDEEVQTEEIPVSNRWTQWPAEFSNLREIKATSNPLYKEEFTGVGVDPRPESPRFKAEKKFNLHRLKRFLDATYQILAANLDVANQFGKLELKQNPDEIALSKGFSKLNIKGLHFLKDRSVTSLSVSRGSNSLLLTVHDKDHAAKILDMKYQSVICLWNVFDPDRPKKILACPGEIRACCIDSKNSSVVAGLRDGSLNAWDLFEDEQFHREVFDGKECHKINICCYSTVPQVDMHAGEVISVKYLGSDGKSRTNVKIDNYQICSLDEFSVIIKWNVFCNRKSPGSDPGGTAWGRLSLSAEARFDLRHLYPEFPDLHCTDMAFGQSDPNYLFVASNFGCVLHVQSSGSKVSPSKYHLATEEGIAQKVNCLDICPFSDIYFLAGCEDGSVQMFCTSFERPIAVYRDYVSPGPAYRLTWLESRPNAFITLSGNDHVSVWSLAKMTPEHRLPFPAIADILPLPLGKDPRRMVHFAVLLKDGSVQIHAAQDEFCYDTKRHSMELAEFYRFANNL